MKKKLHKNFIRIVKTCNSDISKMLDILISTAKTTAIEHTDSKEVQLKGGMYNRAAGGYLDMRLPNGKRCMKRSC